MTMGGRSPVTGFCSGVANPSGTFRHIVQCQNGTEASGWRKVNGHLIPHPTESTLC